MGKKTFETALKNLEEIVRQMESNDLDLKMQLKNMKLALKSQNSASIFLIKQKKKFLC
jgi:exodeoxyribonuclease VII small subunit